MLSRLSCFSSRGRRSPTSREEETEWEGWRPELREEELLEGSREEDEWAERWLLLLLLEFLLLLLWLLLLLLFLLLLLLLLPVEARPRERGRRDSGLLERL